MNITLEIIGILLSSFFILVAAYGTIKRKYNLFLFGICLHGTIPVGGGIIAFAKDENILHLVIAVMFLIQVIFTLPTSFRYGHKNKTALALIKRIGYAILIANLFTGYLILNDSIDVTHQFGYMHFAVSIIIFYTLVRSYKRKGWT